MENINQKISTVLKQLRRDRGWSLDVTSQHTKVSKAMLGQIERGESSPTIATLWKIASGFGVSFSSFIDETSSDPSVFDHRKGSLDFMHEHDDKIRILPIFSYDQTLGFEIFIIELLPGCEHLSPPHDRGTIEHVVVTDGSMEVLVGDTWHPMNQHEGLRFDANVVHGYRNLSTKPAVFHDTIHYAKAKMD